MSIVHLQSVEILNAEAKFQDAYIFKITFECISPLQDDIEWRLVYVGSAGDEKYDQELDNCMVGPVPVGKHHSPPPLSHLCKPTDELCSLHAMAWFVATGVNSFEFEAAAPSPSKIPPEDLLGVTVILLTASYRDQEFIRVGYYVNNAYETEELRENPPEKVDLTQVRREVLVSKPRVTRFNIKWDDSTAALAPQQQGSGEGVMA